MFLTILESQGAQHGRVHHPRRLLSGVHFNSKKKKNANPKTVATRKRLEVQGSQQEILNRGWKREGANVGLNVRGATVT